jgi:hypothetical protein
MEILRKNPGRALLALLLLTLAFGTLAALLVGGKAVLLDPPPYKSPGRLAILTGVFDDEGKREEWGISQIDFLDYRRQSQAFRQLAAFSPGGGMDFNLVSGNEAERVSGELVSYNYFSLLGEEPALGRAFTAEEDGTPFAHPVVVLSWDLWQGRLKGDRGVIGSSLSLNGQPYKVVGVAPKGFRGLSDQAAVWIPSSMPPNEVYVSNRRMRWLQAVGRLQPGVTAAAAQKDLDRIAGALAQKYPDSNKGMSVRVDALDNWTADLRPGLKRLTAVALLLLLLAYADVAGLLRGGSGVQPPPQGREVLAGSLLLSAAGAVLGLALASWAAAALAPASGIPFPSYVHLAVSPEVIAAVLALALAGGLAAGFLARAGRRFQRASAVVQLALALALVVNAGLMATHYSHAVRRDHLGFRPENLLVLRANLDGPKYAKDETVIEVVRQYLDRLPKVPGVKALALAEPTIPTDDWVGNYITIDDHDSGTPMGTYPIMTHSISPDYFKVLNVPVLQGRAFTMQDASPVGAPFNAIVSKAMAEKHWPGKNPIGRRVKFGVRKGTEHPWLPVVGVVGEVQHEGLMKDKRPAPDIYLPILAFPIRLPTTLNFLVVPQPGVSTASLIPVLQREIHAITPDTPAYDPATMEERLAKQTQKGWFQVALAIFFSLVALILAATGVYNAVDARRSDLRT